MKEVIVNVTIEGITPLLHNNRPPEEDSGKKKATAAYIPKDDAMRKAHFDPKLGFFVPCAMLAASIREAGAKFKQGRGTAKKLAVYSITVKGDDEKIPLKRKENECAIDTRWGTHPSTGNSVAVSRVRFDKWSLSFQLAVNVDRMDLSLAEKILEEAGDICGIGSYNPANKSPGPYGRFKVTKWKVVE